MVEEVYFTVNEVAERFKVSRKAVYDWMRTGGLRFVVVGGHRRIPQSALFDFVRPGSPDEAEENSQKKLEPALAF